MFLGKSPHSGLLDKKKPEPLGGGGSPKAVAKVPAKAAGLMDGGKLPTRQGDLAHATGIGPETTRTSTRTQSIGKFLGKEKKMSVTQRIRRPFRHDRSRKLFFSFLVT